MSAAPNPSQVFIERPVATSLLMVAILLAGILAYQLLPQAALPQVDYPSIQVTTFYPGASPELMTRVVTAPLERQFGAIAGLKQMSSSSASGVSQVTLQFELALRLDIAEQSVQAAINSALNFLPRDLPSPPVYSKINPADLPVLTLAITSATLPTTQVQDWADTYLALKIAQISGVGQVALSGGQRPAVRIKVNPQALASHGLGLEQLRAAIVGANSNQAKGNFDSLEQSFTLDANSQLQKPEDYAALVINSSSDTSLRIGDVAEVSWGAENTQLAAWAGQTPAILVNVRRQPGANVIGVADQILSLLPEIQASLPAAVKIEVLSDRTRSIRAALHDVKFELCLAVGLVVMVIFVFLRSAAATLIPSLAVPLSLVGTFGVMYLAGFSLNNLTLMALTIATGFVVDDAIVMIENIARHREMGKSAFKAALEGSREIGFTIISLTFSLLAVLIPLLFMGDVVGRLFREFAITLAVAILISACVSLSLTPMLCARLLRARAHQVKSSAWQEHLTARYTQALNWVVSHQTIMLGLVLFTLGLTAYLAMAIPKGFFPSQDTSLLQGISLGKADTGFTAMSAQQQTLVARLEADPAVAAVASVVGVDNSNTQLNQGRLLITLKPRHLRGSLPDVMARLQASAEQVGMPLFLQAAQDLSLDDRPSQSQYQLLLSSPDADLLANWLPQVTATLGQLSTVRDLASDQPPQVAGAYIAVDRDSASRLGVSQAAVDEVLYSAFGQRLISTIFTQSKQYRVVLEVDSQDKGLARLQDLFVTGSGGRQIPLSSLAQWSERPSSLLITRDKQFPAATLSFNLAPGVSIGEAVASIDGALAQMDWPAGVEKRYQGAAQAFGEALENQLWLIAAALLTMYIVLGVLYESYIHPLTILSTLPSAGIGALAALWACGEDLSVIAIIGIVLLIGIVQKNAIMIIDFALDAQRNQGKTAREAAVQACVLRLRPIVMTSLAALLSAVPLVLGQGEGSELRRPLGISLIGGLLASQALTLFTTPVVYLAFDRLKTWQQGLQKSTPTTALAPTSGQPF